MTLIAILIFDEKKMTTQIITKPGCLLETFQTQDLVLDALVIQILPYNPNKQTQNNHSQIHHQ
jgi:hypothetical protein